LVMSFFLSSQLWVCIVQCWSCIFSLSFYKFNDASPKCTCLIVPSNKMCTFLQVKIYVHLDLFQVKKIY
jgi:hypothetical protein